MFINDHGKPCALRYEGEHRLTFFAFMFEAIPDEVPVVSVAENGAPESEPLTIPMILMGATLDWLGVEPDVAVLAPVSGDEWYGENNVKWTAIHPEDAELTISLACSFDDGATWTTFATGLEMTESTHGT